MDHGYVSPQLQKLHLYIVRKRSAACEKISGEPFGEIADLGKVAGSQAKVGTNNRLCCFHSRRLFLLSGAAQMPYPLPYFRFRIIFRYETGPCKSFYFESWSTA